MSTKKVLTKSVIEQHYPHMQHQADECQLCREICDQAIASGYLETERDALLGDKDEYCEIVRVLGMDEEGSVVEEVLRLVKAELDLRERERMLSRQIGEFATSLRQCEKQLVSCAHAYRRVSNFDESQRCSGIVFQARLVLKKWEET